MSQPLLCIEDLQVEFKTSAGRVRALNGVSLQVQPGEVFGLVGETGCGKTVTGLSVLRLLPRSAQIVSGRILLNGVNLLELSNKEMRQVRGGKVAVIFQDPSSSLNPVFTIRQQFDRIIKEHLDINRSQVVEREREILTAVGLPDVDRILDSYPHQLSGGMRQRVMIAIALSLRPSLLIADEPTTALDVTIQAQILALLGDLRKQFGVSILLITHNLGVVAEVCDRLAVLYAGRVVEVGSTQAIFERPQHPYTNGLLAAVPRPGSRGRQLAAIPGTVPADPGSVAGCVFAPRCASAWERCRQEVPDLFSTSENQASACFLSQPALTEGK